MIHKYERELRRSWISEWARKLYKIQLENWRKKFRNLIHEAWKDEEYERYCERESERDREDLKMNMFDREEQWLEENWLEAYDYYNDL